ncbi:MAG: single-stranded DNA-binding protein [Ruminococcus sp.]|nr:single-stranded DNA-binding protein [Ruminococcus sp.]
MNKVILMGRLTADPVLNQTPSGVSSCRFTIAINRNFKNQNGGYDADFIDCIAWRQTAEFICRYFKKGNMIMAEATLRNNNYQDKKYPDVTHYKLEVVVDNVEFTGSKAEMNTGNNNYQQNNNGYNNGYNNNNYNNNYNNGYGNNNNFQTPPAQPAPQFQQPVPNNDNVSYGDKSEFEDIIGDNDVPF